MFLIATAAMSESTLVEQWIVELFLQLIFLLVCSSSTILNLTSPAFYLSNLLLGCTLHSRNIKLAILYTSVHVWSNPSATHLDIWQKPRKHRLFSSPSLLGNSRHVAWCKNHHLGSSAGLLSNPNPSNIDDTTSGLWFCYQYP